MMLVSASLRNPTAVVVTCLAVLLFGYVAFTRIPIQMTPTVERPEITVSTTYPGAAPQEVEQQITIPMEEQLNSVENLRRLTSNSSEGSSQITLQFDWGVNGDAAIADIRDRLDQVKNLPDDIDRPQIASVGRASASPVFWMTGLYNGDINDFRQIADDVITPRLRRIDGVGDVLQYGGEEREIAVYVDLEALRARNLTVAQVRQAILNENKNVRGGNLDSGRRRFVVRTVGQFESVQALQDLIIARPESGIIHLSDVAEVVDSHVDPDFRVKYNGDPAIAFGILKKSSANTIEVVAAVRQALAELNDQLGPRGARLEAAYDQTEYIWDSIHMVNESLLIGALLAIVMLLLFLRSPSSVIIIAIDIPICLVGAIIMLWATGRTLNIVSLAGLAFSVGLVVDNSIVVLENIFRHLERGEDSRTAARNGATEVWLAVFASTLVHIAVFAPVVLIKEEAGQLFADLALSISFAVITSLFMAMYVTPVACAKFLHLPGHEDHSAGEGRIHRLWHGLHLLADKIDLSFIGRGFANAYRAMLHTVLDSALVRVCALSFMAILFGIGFYFKPPQEYLPQGNQNLLITIIFPAHWDPKLRIPRGQVVAAASIVSPKY